MNDPDAPDIVSQDTLARGWFKAVRSDDALELLRANPLALALAYVIATRAKWRGGFSQHNLKSGEAFIGDYENYGMSERSYRTAKLHLAKWHFATFKATNKGTVAKLIDTRLFEVATTIGDGQNADNRRAGDGQNDRQATTNEERKTKRMEEGKKFRDSRSSKRVGGSEPADDWSGDGYLQDKLARNPKLLSELKAGRTKLAMEFAELYLLDDGAAKELAAEATEKNNPAAWLNRSVSAKLKELSR